MVVNLHNLSNEDPDNDLVFQYLQEANSEIPIFYWTNNQHQTITYRTNTDSDDQIWYIREDWNINLQSAREWHTRGRPRRDRRP